MQAIRRILSWIFPERCACCGEVVAFDEGICATCAADVTPIAAPVCAVCGWSAAHCRCHHFFGRHRYTAGCVAPYAYQGAAQRAVRRLKFHGAPEACVWLCDAMADRVRAAYAAVPFDCIVPVPLHRQTRRYRGHDQCAMLAEGLSSRLHIPLQAALSKPWSTQPQRELSALRRSGNVFGAFVCADPTIVGKTVLLVDDISTTGATLDECAKTLLIGGACEVYAVVAALTAPDRNKEE